MSKKDGWIRKWFRKKQNSEEVHDKTRMKSTRKKDVKTKKERINKDKASRTGNVNSIG